MRGLAGYISAAPAAAAPVAAAAEVRRRLATRGAGDAAWLIQRRGRGHVLLLSGATREDARHGLAFDGRLTNSAALLARLLEAGHAPAGDADADMVAAAWQAWGTAMLPRLEGAFALAVLDRRSGTVTLARDRFGQRPLLVAATGGCVAFASDLATLLAWPGLRREADLDVLAAILAFGHAPVDRTPMAGLHRLPPGHVLQVAADGTATQSAWWALPPMASAAERPADDLARQIVATVRAAAGPGRAAVLHQGEAAPLLLACLQDPIEPAIPPPAPDADLVQRLVRLQGEPIVPEALVPALGTGVAGRLLLSPTGAAELLLAHRRYRLFVRDLARLREGTREMDGGFHEAPPTARDLWHAASGGTSEAERLGLLGPALLHTLVLAAPDTYGLSLDEADPALAMAEAARLDLALRVPARDLAALDAAAGATGASFVCPFLDSGLVQALAGLPDAARRWLIRCGSPAEADLSAWHPMAPPLRDFTEATLLGAACRGRDLFSRGRVEALLRRHAAMPGLDTAGLTAAVLWPMLGVELWCQAFVDAPARQPQAAQPEIERPEERLLAAMREAA
jgi:asparagine synthase (glutamine-hydrolysing)